MMGVVKETPLHVGLLEKDFLTLANVTPEKIKLLLKNAKTIKDMHKNGEIFQPLKGKILGMIFEKPSTRTRVSFEAGMYQLGGQAIYLNSGDMQIGRGETIADTAKILSEYIDAIMIRTFSHDIIEELANNASIPVINGLTDKYHPCQALADMLTIQEIKGDVSGLKFVYVGDGNNVAHSLMIACAKLGMHCTIACPEGYEPDNDVTKLAKSIADSTNTIIEIMHDPTVAVTGADVVYTDVWMSMGDNEGEEKMKKFVPFQVNMDLVKRAKEDYIFLHCLPAHRGEEVTAEIIDGNHSAVFQQAGNRLHVQKVILTELLK